ncbi:glycoprotein X [Drepanopeziza brunnea f. sp. 'multigermtubi' MB_m1]|uniref:Glycoprotein X n=1 Tax=Marssonina brunnea f. sp. multigermtubi (strain MB_m1) TaxID=1072389 RepID=K1XRY8_MARBU|nr:glycoprotein X [Drepanopeziza brunnea f. sp. 'multigermtubi' MB_m1]EKD15359.1 glycoprotein X [Drepanopeziza brunnea f. sp. 'multigermtubi' MB_m1]
MQTVLSSGSYYHNPAVPGDRHILCNGFNEFISLITSFTTLPGEITTLPGQITTLLASTITLPAQTTTLSGQITTLPASTITLPGQITTLPGAIISFTASGEITTLPGQITTLAGSVSTRTLPGLVTTLAGTVCTILGPYPTITISGATSVSMSKLPEHVTTLSGQIVTLPGATSLSTIPGIVSTIAGPPGPTLTLPPVLSTTLIPGSTIINPGPSVTASSLVICPKPTNLPGVAVTPQDKGPNALWGCSPGYVCNVPKPAGCDIFADPPDYDYLCDAKYCIPSPLFPVVTWPKGETAYYPLTEGYFNLNPQAFGLDFTIFVTNVVVITVAGKYGNLETITEAGQYSSQSSAYTPINSAHAHWKKSREEHVQAREAWVQARDTLHLLKRDASVAPAVCFAQCNNCYIEAQSVGKSPALCAADSAFRSYYEGCQSCVASNSATPEESLAVYVEPKFAEFTGYCDAQAPPIPVLDGSFTSTVPVTRTETPLPVTVSVVWHGFYPNLYLHTSSCIPKLSIKWPRDIAQHDTQPATNDFRT